MKQERKSGVDCTSQYLPERLSEVSLGVLVRSLLDFAECGCGCFYGSVEVSPDEALEEYADGPGSPIVEFVDFLSDKDFCLVS